MSFNIVLIEPEIPQNTGNIVRTCVATNAKLHLVRPLGFEVSDKHLKRAGLDYWNEAEIFYYDSFAELAEQNQNANFWYATTKAKKTYVEVKYTPNDFIVFGRESKGIPEILLHENYSSCIRIPMVRDTRSLNLSNSVAIVLYEALRQIDFDDDFTQYGKLTKY